MECLSAEERVRSGRYLHAGSRRRFILCRAALRAVLCHRLACNGQQITFGASSYGKPFARVDETPSPVGFNVSHAGSHGLIAVAPRGRIGVDIEERVPRDDLNDLTDAVLGPNEKREFVLLHGNRRTHFFYRMWTLKEALIKALGHGFSQDPAEFEVPLAVRRGARAGTLRFPNRPRSLWRVNDLGTEKFAAAVAVETNPGHSLMSAE
ncbi:MAG: 4'-phosphopantetheinyl transferase superfamily protein [Chloroflexota bacterium]|nr:4'-phosphopantetheinyl transferase superfamily protein [Chloroflexota bacterium]MDE2920454.1 4'-phosphopantetheinyl transferase superfamily protein [Chloroflexota bacterium]